MALVDSSTGTFSCWYFYHGADPLLNDTITFLAHSADFIDTVITVHLGIAFVNTIDFTDEFDVVHYTDPDLYLFINGTGEFASYNDPIDNPGTYSTIVHTTGGNVLSEASGWRHVMMSWSLNGSVFIGSIYIDDIQNTVLDTFTTGTVAWGDVPIGGSLSMLSRAFQPSTAGNTFWGCVSDYYLNTDEYLDLTIEANRRKFITFDGQPVDLGTNGELPTGTAPQFYFKSGAADFPTNVGLYGPVNLSSTFIDCEEGCAEIAGPWYFSQNFPSDSSGNPQIVYGFDSTTIHDAGFSFFESYILASIYGVTQARVDGIIGDIFGDPFITQLPWGEVYDPNTGNDGGGAIDTFFGSVFWAVNKSSNDDIDMYAAPTSVTNPVSIPPVFTYDETITGAQRLFISSENWGAEGSNLYMGSSPASGNSPQIWMRGFGGIGDGGQWSNVKSFDNTRREVTCLFGAGNVAMYAGVSGTAGNDAEIWSTLDGSTWSLVTSFPGRTHISAINRINFGSSNDMYVLVYEPGVAREVYISVQNFFAPEIYTTFTLDFSFSVGAAGSRLSTLAKRDSYTPDNTPMLFAGLGNDGGIVNDAKVYAYDGISWFLSADFNETFSDTNPSVTAMTFGAQGYAATGDFALGNSGINIYTYRYESLP